MRSFNNALMRTLNAFRDARPAKGDKKIAGRATARARLVITLALIAVAALALATCRNSHVGTAIISAVIGYWLKPSSN